MDYTVMHRVLGTVLSQGLFIIIIIHTGNCPLSLLIQFQSAQVEKFCQRHGITSALPSEQHSLQLLFHHLIYSDDREVLFCYVPKTGSSNLKAMLLTLEGVVSPEVVRKQTRPKELFSQVL